MDWYARYEKAFRRRKKTVKIGLTLTPLFLAIWLFALFLTDSKLIHLLSFILLTIPVRFVVYGLWMLFGLHNSFLHRSKIREAAIALHRVGGPIRLPRFRMLFKFRSLYAFEDWAVKDLRRFTKKLVDAKRKLEKTDSEIQRIEDTKKQLSELEKRFSEVIEGVESEEELEKYLKDYKAAKNLDDLRRMISNLEYKIWERKNSQDKFEVKIKDLNRILEESAGDDPAYAAREFLQESNRALDPKMKIKYLKAAVTEQKKANKEKTGGRSKTKTNTFAAF